MSRLKKFFSSFYNIFLTFLGVLVTLPILAPILLHLNLERPAKVIYFIYSFFCHQFATRSIDIYDYQIAWCARDTGIWTAMFITGLLVKFNKLPRLRWFWVIPFIIPMALDGGLQTIFTFLNLSPAGMVSGESIYVSNNLSRYLTGAIFGIGVGWWLCQQIKDISNNKIEEITASSKNLLEKYSHLSWSILLTLVMFIIYVVFVQVWTLTSPVNKPLNGLDSAVKSSNDLFFARRGNAVCPTSGAADLFQFDCFFRN